MSNDEEHNVIAVGLDTSAASLAAVRWAARQADRLGRTLRLVHAYEPAGRGEAGRSGAPSPPERARQLAESTSEELHRRRPRLPVDTEVVAGGPEQVLLKAASEARVLVIGTHGMPRVQSFFLGNTGLAIVSRAERPVVLVRASVEGEAEAEARAEGAESAGGMADVGGEAPGGGAGTGRTGGGEDGSGQDEAGRQPALGTDAEEGRVVVGLGLDHSYDSLLGFAFRTAADSGLPLHVIHGMKLPPEVHAPGGGPVVPHLAVEFRKRREDEIRSRLRPWSERYPQVRVRGGLRLENPARALIREAAGSDLLVVGRCRRHRPALGPRIGPVAQAAVHHAGCPVAVVPHD